MYLLEDNIYELMIGVSLKTKYKDKTVDELKEIINSFNTEGMYNYHYMLHLFVIFLALPLFQSNQLLHLKMMVFL